MKEMTKYEAYSYQCDRLTEEQRLQLNAKENNIGRKLTAGEIATVFKLEPAGKVEPRRKRMSDQIEESKDWMD